MERQLHPDGRNRGAGGWFEGDGEAEGLLISRYEDQPHRRVRAGQKRLNPAHPLPRQTIDQPDLLQSGNSDHLTIEGYMRRPAVVAAGAAALSVVAGTLVAAASASDSKSVARVAAQQSTQHTALSSGCQAGMVRVTPDSSNGVIAHKPGEAVSVRAVVKNNSRTTLKLATFDYELAIGNYNHWAPTPSLSWRLGTGPWHKLGVTFHPGNPRDQYSLSYWYASGVSIGTLKARSTHSLDMKMSFHRGDPARFYLGDLMILSRTCGSMETGHGTLLFGYRM
jgi:hypothetical protein